MKTILVTGAAGDLGGHLRRQLAGKFRLRLSDLRPIKDLSAGETFVRADLAELRDMVKATRGVDAVVHLGGYAGEGSWEVILRANLIGTYNTFEAARRNGVKRILFASSNHAVGFFRRDQTIDHHVYPKPDSRYGVSKVFGEQLGSLYADKYGMQVVCMRIGNVTPAPVDKRRLSSWLSPRDFGHLVSVCVEYPDIHFEIVYGASNNVRTWYNNANAHRLGYHPEDNAETFAAEVLAREKPDPDARITTYQGGTFVTAEAVAAASGPPPRPPAKRPKAAKKKRRPARTKRR